MIINILENFERLKLELDFKSWNIRYRYKITKKSCKTKCWSRNNKRINDIIKIKLIELKKILKFIGENFPIAKLQPGKDYLEPEISLIVDDIIEIQIKKTY